MGVPTVQPTGPSGNDYVHIDDTAYRGEGAFGGLQARALQQSGSDLEKAGNNLAGTADLIQGRYNQIAIDGAYNQLQDKYYDLTFGNPDAIFRLSGKDAMDKGPAVQQQITDARKEVYGGLQNDFQKLQFDDISRRLQANTLERVGTHITNQMHAWGVENSKAMVFNAARNAGADYDNEGTFQDSLTQAQMGAARATINSGNAADPEVSAMNRSLAVNSVVQNRFDGLYSADPIKAGNWLLNGKTADGTPVRSLVSGPAGDQLIEKAQTAQDKGFVDGLFQKYLGGPSSGGAAPSQGGTPFTPKSLPPGVTLNEDAMVRTVAGEAGAEPLKGQQAVAAVIMNRANGSGASPRDVVFAPNQFEPWNGGAARQRLEAMDPSSPQYQSILNNVVRPMMSGQVADPTNGATHFYAPVAQAALGRAAPPWATGTPTVIGGHNFYNVGYTPGSAPAAPIGTAATPAPDVPAPALAAMPDESGMVNDVLQAYPAGPRRDKLVADVRSQMNELRLSVHTQADDFLHTLPDLQSSLLAGNSRPIPEDMIKHFLPPADAARQIENLHIAQSAGQEFRAVKWGSPQEVQAAGNRLLADLRMPGGTSIEDAPAPVVDENSDEAFRLRASILTKFQEQVKARRAALESNSADYVSSNPLVVGKAAALQAAGTDAEKAAATKDYFNTMLTVEGSLGVPPDKQHIMTRDTAEGEVGKLLNADPETNDAAAQMVKMQKDFGDVWPKAYHDLVSLGNLPDGYKTLAEIPAATVRWDYNQMLRLTKERGGVDKWQGDAGQSGGASNIRQINNTIDGDQNLAALRSSLHVPGVFADDQNYTRIRDSVKNLAAYYSTFDGMSGPDALKKASDGIIGQKYDMDGTLRVAKGPNGENRLGVVESYGDTLLSGLKPEDLSPTQGRLAVSMPPIEASQGEIGATAALHAQRQAEMLAQARSTGRWVTNPMDDGAYLIGQDRNGVMYPVRRANGSIVAFKFGDAMSSGATDRGLTQTPYASPWLNPSSQMMR